MRKVLRTETIEEATTILEQINNSCGYPTPDGSVITYSNIINFYTGTTESDMWGYGFYLPIEGSGECVYNIVNNYPDYIYEIVGIDKLCNNTPCDEGEYILEQQ